MQALTDLEGAVLAKIARDGVATRYAVARSFTESPSEFWSGSAGAVYPLIRRLQARQWLKSTRASDGRRARTDYSVTAKGHAALRSWLLDPARAADLGFDPLRSRAVHLDMVSAAERARFFAGVERALRTMAAKPVWQDSPRDRRLHEAVLAARMQLLRALVKLAESD